MVTAFQVSASSALQPASGLSADQPGVISESWTTGRCREIIRVVGAGRSQSSALPPDSGPSGGLPGHISGRPGIGPAAGDYDGDGSIEISIYRPSSGLWAVKDISRLYFGDSFARAIPADYDGDSQDDFGIFRSDSGLWAIREISRVYFGTTGDTPVTGNW